MKTTRKQRRVAGGARQQQAATLGLRLPAKKRKLRLLVLKQQKPGSTKNRTRMLEDAL